MDKRVKNPKIAVKKVDGTRPAELKKVLKGKDLVISSVSWGLLKNVLKMACETKTNYMDFSLSGNSMDEFREQQKMVEKSGITAITACGADPGISDVFARYGADPLDAPGEAYVREGDCGVAGGYNFFTLLR